MLADGLGFAILEERSERAIERRAYLLSQYILGSHQVVDQHKVDRERGFIEGVRWFFQEVRNLDSELRAEQTQDEEDDSV
jgi:hypothetical protein